MAKNKTAKKAAAEKKGPQKGPREGHTIANTTRANILKGLNWEQHKAVLDKEFPKNHSSKACYFWYRNKLKKDGENVPELVRAKKEKAPKKAKTPKAAKTKSGRGKKITDTAAAVAEAEGAGTPSTEAVPA